MLRRPHPSIGPRRRRHKCLTETRTQTLRARSRFAADLPHAWSSRLLRPLPSIAENSLGVHARLTHQIIRSTYWATWADGIQNLANAHKTDAVTKTKSQHATTLACILGLAGRIGSSARGTSNHTPH
eukprot:4498370-Amphidinium_carterae.1